MRKIYNKFLNILILMTINKKADKAKPRVIVGRLPAITGGRPPVPEMEKAGKATGPRSLGQLGCRSYTPVRNRIVVAFYNR